VRARFLTLATLFVVVIALAFLLRPIWFFDDYTYLRDDLNGVFSHSITVSGVRIHYLAAGPSSGEPVILVHGLGGRAENWRNLAPVLAQQGYRVYMPDLPGFGRSDRPVNYSYSVPDQADFVVAFLDALHLRQVDLGGWSMGGWIAQILAARHPERVSRLLLFDSVGLAVAPTWNTALFTPANAAELDQLEALLETAPHPIPGFIARDIIRVSRQSDWVIHRALTSMLTGRDAATDALLPRLEMPVLIAWGTADRITPLSLGETMHKLIPSSVLDLAPDCGHLAPVECTPQLTPPILAFLKIPAGRSAQANHRMTPSPLGGIAVAAPASGSMP
jgi:pimeloyl-ACP methyl ester carboxylesterase